MLLLQLMQLSEWTKQDGEDRRRIDDREEVTVLPCSLVASLKPCSVVEIQRNLIT